jgi:uncharacterized protein YndB with AHSA1/START domain
LPLCAPAPRQYTARSLHKDDADRAQHQAMGFEEGWGAAADQLVALVKSLRGGAQ